MMGEHGGEKDDLRRVVEGFYIGLTFGLGAIILHLWRRQHGTSKTR